MSGEYISTGITILISIMTGLLSGGIAWGLIQGKVRELEKDVAELNDRQDTLVARHERFPDNYVTREHFKAITIPIQENIREIQHDIKQILIIVSKNEPPPRRNKTLSDT